MCSTKMFNEHCSHCKCLDLQQQTLVFSEESSKSNINYYLSTIPAKTEQFHVDFKDHGLDMHDFNRVTIRNEMLTRQILYMSSKPQRNQGINKNGFKAVDWSPSGCDIYGRLVVTSFVYIV